MKTITNAQGRVIGFENDYGNVVFIYNAKGVQVGKYVKGHDMTYFASGAKVGRGNLTRMLLSL